MHALLTYKRDAESKDDYQLALRELAALAGMRPREVSHLQAKEILGRKALPFFHREQTLCAVEVNEEVAARLLRRLAFWDFMYVHAEADITADRIANGNAWASIDGVLVFATQSRVLEWTAYSKDDPAISHALRTGHSLEALVKCGQPYVDAAIDAPLTSISRRKNEYLTHGFHKYKAKFFPRLARSLINIVSPGDTGIILDPYCGSGTTGVEASLMGLTARQFDLDPLSALIAHSKASLGHLDVTKFRRAVERIPSAAKLPRTGSLLDVDPYKLPRFLLERNPKRLPAETVAEIEQEATVIQQIIAAGRDKETRELFQLAFSHALATKISLRWMGTGDNRFALELGQKSLYGVFHRQLQYMIRKLDTWAAIRDGQFVSHYGRADVGVSDCTSLPLEDSSVDAIVTSPPYLPAASGRETYLRSRAASLLGLALMSEKAILKCEKHIVGSILAEPAGTEPLPDSVVDLVNWMLPQRERTSKAKPTTAYFEKLGQSLKEMQRVLKPGGKIALVVSKEHMFYELTTRKVLRRFDMVDAVTQLATASAYGIGLELDGVQDLELFKMDFAARPGSRGTYSESIVLFRKLAATQVQSKRKKMAASRAVTSPMNSLL